MKKIKLENDPNNDESQSIDCNNIGSNNSINNNNWKEVQLRISENGEMSITGIDTNLDSSLLEIVNSDTKYKNEVTTVAATTVTTSMTTTSVNKFDETHYQMNSISPENGKFFCTYQHEKFFQIQFPSNIQYC